MSISSKIKTVFRGDVPLADLPREAARRRQRAARRKQERRDLETINNAPARLVDRFNTLSTPDLLQHFRERSFSFFQFDASNDSERLATLFPDETARLITTADLIVSKSKWEIAGFGFVKFNAENFWRRDPFTGKDWGIDYHADVVVYENDGADIRVLWELNRFGHAVALACAYAVTGNEFYAETCFSHIESWMQQNSYAKGANWNCAMEVALRAINLLASFDILRKSKAMTEDRLTKILKFFDQHGRYILENNEFSYISTSNHYLSDVIGLFWIGTFLPELEQASKWRDFGLAEMLREMDKQILPDGADFEASTGYHRFVTEMFLYSFILAKRFGIDIKQTSSEKLRLMLRYLRGIMHPDGRMPLIGDADGSQIIPIVKRDAYDAGYLLPMGAAVLNDETLIQAGPEPEVFWFFGESAISSLRKTAGNMPASSDHFPNARAVVLRDGDFYLHFNANDCGVSGRGSHAHNDALSIEVSAFGRPFISDPGSYVYNLDRGARHTFRSTAYHSTVMIDDAEQNTTDAALPFIMGNEASPKLVEWHTSAKSDRASAEHYGYTRLADPVTHQRTIEFDKQNKTWTIEDKLSCKHRHKFMFSFHLASDIKANQVNERTIRLSDANKKELFVQVIGVDAKPDVISAFASRNYGHREESSILKWTVTADGPFTAQFIISPNCLQ
jgi:uncharacterized heparinase superfamily protein